MRLYENVENEIVYLSIQLSNVCNQFNSQHLCAVISSEIFRWSSHVPAEITRIKLNAAQQQVIPAGVFRAMLRAVSNPPTKLSYVIFNLGKFLNINPPEVSHVEKEKKQKKKAIRLNDRYVIAFGSIMKEETEVYYCKIKSVASICSHHSFDLSTLPHHFAFFVRVKRWSEGNHSEWASPRDKSSFETESS
ncbi:CLUMA_CG001750, isoform A [Clunio marinus]|uniref:CLUMA_CG001750, isoform A n=1 Tax=Clunio marinus TaxID=568069 RepID=A0A1J1HKM5_9DIPT|nr:CLUMA_CG001750, isoform A [Clunio marinus]